MSLSGITHNEQVGRRIVLRHSCTIKYQHRCFKKDKVTYFQNVWRMVCSLYHSFSCLKIILIVVYLSNSFDFRPLWVQMSHFISITFPLSSKEPVACLWKAWGESSGGLCRRTLADPLPVLESCLTESGGGGLKMIIKQSRKHSHKEHRHVCWEPRREECAAWSIFLWFSKSAFVPLTLKLFTLFFKF